MTTETTQPSAKIPVFFTWIYNAAFLFFGLLYLPRFISKLKQAEDPGLLLRQRLGFFSESFCQRFQGTPVLWVHAVSVGEVLAVRKFIEGFLARTRDFHVILTTVTATGQQMARQMEGERVSVCYFPLDFTWTVRRFLKAVRPHVLLLAETEIWPNLISETKRLGIPVGVLNARLSRRSQKGYRFFHFFFRSLFRSLDFVMTQTEEDAERFRSLGVPHPGIFVMGNMKFDNASSDRTDETPLEALRKEWGFGTGDLVWIAGSTHPGEEQALTKVYCKLRDQFKTLKLIIAPRHIERSERLLRQIEKQGVRVSRATRRAESEPVEVLILDQLGILRHLYRIADVVFVGGSLIHRGGQNPIEPASFKRAIVHGPHVVNFLSVYQVLDQNGGALLVTDERQMAFAVSRLLENREERRRLGENAFELVEQMKGATKRHLDWVLRFLSPRFQERISNAKLNEKLFSQAGGRL